MKLTSAPTRSSMNKDHRNSGLVSTFLRSGNVGVHEAKLAGWRGAPEGSLAGRVAGIHRETEQLDMPQRNIIH